MVFEIDFPEIMNDELPQSEQLREIKSYLYRLRECLSYAFENIDEDNMTETARATLSASRTAAVKVTELSEENAKELQDVIKKLRAEIIASASKVSSDTKTAYEKLVDGKMEIIASTYVARTEGDDDTTVAQLKEFVTHSIKDTSAEWTNTFKNTTEIIKQTADSLENYKKEVETYIRMDINGITIGKEEDGKKVPYSVVIDNEKLAFYYMGQSEPVGYIKYNKLYITAIEVLDRLSIGRSENGGFFDWITTDTGVGFKWREA